MTPINFFWCCSLGFHICFQPNTVWVIDPIQAGVIQSFVAICIQNSKQHFGKQAENSFQRKESISSMHQSKAYKSVHCLTFTFFSFLVLQRCFAMVIWWFCDVCISEGCKRSIALQSFFFPFNLSITDNKWHLNSPQGSTESCQKENAVQSMKKSMCKGLCEQVSLSVQHNSMLKASVLLVHVWENTRKCVCVHLCGLVCGRDLLTLTFVLYAS